MDPIRIHSLAEQVAAHLRKQILMGKLSGMMPGVHQVAKELAISSKTIVAALKILEHEGLLEGQGPRRRRKIVLPENHVPSVLRVAIMGGYDTPSQATPYMVDLRHQLEAAGHVPFFTSKTLENLGMNEDRVARFVRKTGADAWIVCAASRGVLQWFVDYEKPAFALFGRRRTLQIAGVGPDQVAARRLLTRRLIALGHRRIVTLARAKVRHPEPSQVVCAIFEEMQAHGISTGTYNLPEWEETPDGFHRLLDTLFRVTPPTALIIDESFLFHAAKDHLAQRGIIAPDRVSLVCTDPDPTFAWHRPSIAHFRWDSRPVVRRILRWVSNVARGRKDHRQTLTGIELVEGGTIGPAPAFTPAPKQRRK